VRAIPGIARKEARVRTECAAHAVQLAIPRDTLTKNASNALHIAITNMTE
jgi:hypothetical protein